MQESQHWAAAWPQDGHLKGRLVELLLAEIRAINHELLQAYDLVGAGSKRRFSNHFA